MKKNRKPIAIVQIFIFLISGGFGYLAQAGTESIVTGGSKGTYVKFGENLRDLVSPGLNVQETEGSWVNVEKMADESGVTLAIVQSDVYDGFFQVRDSKSVSPEVRKNFEKILTSLRVVMPLYIEEVHFIVREDSPLKYVHDIKDAAIWMDEEKSGTHLTGAAVYNSLFGGKPNVVPPFIIDEVRVDDTRNQDEKTKKQRSALLALSNPSFYNRDNKYPKVDVMILVGGQPLELLQRRDRLPSKGLRFLKVNDASSVMSGIWGKYQKTTIKASSYPLIQGGEFTAIGVQSYLITANFRDKVRNDFIRSFSQNFCEKFNALTTKGHPKWKELTWKPGSRLPSINPSWKYSDYASGVLNSCGCSPKDVAIGVCK